MKISLLLPLAIFTTLGSAAHAQMIVFSAPQNITGPADVFTTGQYIDALQTFNAPAEVSVLNPITGVTTPFNIYTSTGTVTNPPTGTPSNFYADNTFSITADGDGGGDGSGSTATPYQAAQNGSTYVNYPGQTPSEIGTVTISGLTLGNEYEVQVWAAAGYRNVTYTSADSVNLNYNPTGLTPSSGQYVLGLFTATGATETFTYQNTYPIDVPAGEIDAIALHDLTVPEPSTYAMIFGGLGVLGLVSRFRGKLTA